MRVLHHQPSFGESPGKSYSSAGAAALQLISLLRSYVEIIRTPARNRSATAAYSRQLIAIEAIVVMIPGKVLHQPAVSIADDGHTITRRSVLPTLMRCHTPKLPRRTNTAPDTIRPTVPPTTAVCRTVIEFALKGTITWTRLFPLHYSRCDARVEIVKDEVYRQGTIFSRDRVAYLAHGAFAVHEVNDLVGVEFRLVADIEQLCSFAVNQFDLRIAFFAQTRQQNIIVLIGQRTEFADTGRQALRYGRVIPGRTWQLSR